MKRYVPLRDSFSGFTLIELLVVVMIMGVVLSVIGACLAAGIRVWDESARFGADESDAIIGLQIMEKDVVNSFSYYAIPFSGKRSDVSFGALVVPSAQTPQGEGGADAQVRMGTVSYVFDAGSMTLFRSQQTYPADPGAAKTQERIMSNLRDVYLEYYRLEAGKGTGSWKDQWTDPTNRPVAVRINLSFQDREDSLTKTVVLPVSDGLVP